MNVEAARSIVTQRCMHLQDYAEISPDELAAIETATPPQVARSAEGWFRLELRYVDPNWDARLRWLFSAPKDGTDLVELARALAIVWRAEDAKERVPDDLVREVERLTGRPVF